MRAYQWMDGTGYGLTLRLTQDHVDTVPNQGPADEAIASLRRDPLIEGQLQAMPMGDVNSHLKEYGAWDDAERADHDENLNRVLWTAIGDIKESPSFYYDI